MDGAYCRFRDCRFTGNSGAAGGAVRIWGVLSRAEFDRCTFRSNVASVRPWQGGAIELTESTCVLARCRLESNQARMGAAIYCAGKGVAQLINVLAAGNSAGTEGGGVYVTNGSVDLANCTFFRNTAEAGSGAQLYSGSQGAILAANSIFWRLDSDAAEGFEVVPGGQVTATHCNVRGGWPGLGNFDLDPRWVDFDGPDDDPGTWDDNDFRLAAGSPCIDAGNNAAVPVGVDLDLAGMPRFHDDPDTPDVGYGAPPLVDMGAYEFGSVLPGDFDGDADVDGDDLVVFRSCFTGPHLGPPSTGCEETDLDGDDDVDQSDFGLFQLWIGGPATE
jgi:hypothetical protein